MQSMKEWTGTQEEWEALCDNCGKCCELRDYQGPFMIKTGLMCPMRKEGKCSVYPIRHLVIKSCNTVTPENIESLGLPNTCAYVRWAKET